MSRHGRGPAFTVRTTWRMHEALVTTCGDIDINTVGQLTDRLGQILRTRPRQLTIDLSGSRYIDAAGCHGLARIAVALPPGHTLTLRRPTRIARRLFAITGLDRICRIEPPSATQPAHRPPSTASAHVRTAGFQEPSSPLLDEMSYPASG